MVRIADNGPGWKYGYVFCRSTIPQKKTKQTKQTKQQNNKQLNKQQNTQDLVQQFFFNAFQFSIFFCRQESDGF